MKDHILLTPGPLTTSAKVKAAMLHDMGTRDQDYQEIVEQVRHDLLQLAHANASDYTCVLLQGSGTYGVESVLTSTIADHQKVLILENGAYGKRMKEICIKANVPHLVMSYSMIDELPLTEIEKVINNDDITHVAYIHCETTAGVMNNIEGIQALIHQYHKISIVDAMSSFGSMDISLDSLGIDYLITSSNKCLHGVPGIAIVFARKAVLESCQGISPSLSLDLYEQNQFMSETPGSFRFTSPTHVILALREAIDELLDTGGIAARSLRYQQVQKAFDQGMKKHGFTTLIDSRVQSNIITTYVCPEGFSFPDFYAYFKQHGILLYSGKLPGVDAFRIGNIGNITDSDVKQFLLLLDEYEETL